MTENPGFSVCADNRKPRASPYVAQSGLEVTHDGKIGLQG